MLHSTGPLLQERAPIEEAKRACLAEIPGNASLQEGSSDSLHKACARRRRRSSRPKGPRGPAKEVDGDNEEAVSLRYRVGKRKLRYDREKGAAFRH